MDSFEQELKVGFIEEARELLTNAEQCFLGLEKAKDDPSIIEEIFRLAHSLKGSAGAVGFADLSHFTHTLESFLLRIKNKELNITNQVISLLLQCNDFLIESLDGLKGNLEYKVDGHDLSARLTGYVETGDETPVEAPVAEERDPSAEVVHLTPVIEAKAKAKAAVKPQASADENIRVSLAKIDQLLNNVGELVIFQTVMNQQKSHVQSQLGQKTIDQMSKIIRELQNISMGLRMLPVKQTFQKMQRIVRDTSEALNKKVDLILSGEETELDKTVLEQLSDPLVHLIRNAVDHGIESGEDRLAKGKPEKGTVNLSAYHRGSQIIIEIQDDGKGLDAEKLMQKAREKGLLKPDEQLAPEQAYQLIFAPGFSTKEAVTDISGRGVGMDVVKTNIKNLQGEIEVSTELGKGSCFKIVLPLTLAIIDGMVVTLDDERYVIPKSQVLETLQPTEKDIARVAERGEVLHLRGNHLPLYRLEKLLGKKKKVEKPAWQGISLVIEDTKRVPFSVLVDDIIGQHQIVVKRLGDELQGMPGVSGAAILGDGKAALILDLQEVSALKNKAA